MLKFFKEYPEYVLCITNLVHYLHFITPEDKVVSRHVSDREALLMMAGYSTPDYFNMKEDPAEFDVAIPVVPDNKFLFEDANHPGVIYIGDQMDVDDFQDCGMAPLRLTLRQAIIALNFPTDYDSVIRICERPTYEHEIC